MATIAEMFEECKSEMGLDSLADHQLSIVEHAFYLSHKKYHSRLIGSLGATAEEFDSHCEAIGKELKDWGRVNGKDFD